MKSSCFSAEPHVIADAILTELSPRLSKAVGAERKEYNVFRTDTQLISVSDELFQDLFSQNLRRNAKKIAYTLPNASKSIHFHIRCQSFLSVSRPPTSCSYSKEELGGH